ncbi:S1 RNA-binding domain-containing protein [Lachnospiraceae bacterium]|nr:S1 RNA-binding domain-containing protein [Lachnospiraceae bacterium]
MAAKKKELLPEEENLQGAIPQTGVNPELEEMPGPEGDPPDTELPQTDTEISVFQDTESGDEPVSQTEAEWADGRPLSEPEDAELSQTDTETAGEGTSSENSLSGESGKEESPQTEPEKPKRTRGSRKTDGKQNQSDTEAGSGEKETPKPRRKRASPRPTSPVLTIDGQLSVETDAEKAKNDLLDLLESQKTGRILTGTIQGVERSEDNQSCSFAVIYHGEFKVIIPAEEAVEPPADYRGRLPEDVLHYMLTKRLGAEVDYIVKGTDPASGIAAASRMEAMKAKRKAYYLSTDREGNNFLYSGVCAEARIVSVIRAGIFVDLFGLEVYIPLRELSYQRWMDAAAYFQPGQRILVKVLEVDRTDRSQIKVKASVKQAGENPYEKALRRYSVGNRYVGTVSMVDTNGVFVALDGGIDCLCSYPKRGRPPRGSRVTVRILGINNDSNRIWGAITHIATAR